METAASFHPTNLIPSKHTTTRTTVFAAHNKAAPLYTADAQTVALTAPMPDALDRAVAVVAKASGGGPRGRLLALLLLASDHRAAVPVSFRRRASHELRASLMQSDACRHDMAVLLRTQPRVTAGLCLCISDGDYSVVAIIKGMCKGDRTVSSFLGGAVTSMCALLAAPVRGCMLVACRVYPF
jgi:hypothetical protein